MQLLRYGLKQDPLPPQGRESRPRMAKELKSGQAIFLVAVADERIAGVVLEPRRP